jgi:hypothetical protein
MTTSAKRSVNRRRFFAALGKASVVMAAAATPAPIAEAYDPGGDERRPRYRESDDVRAFYRTNGYES